MNIVTLVAITALLTGGAAFAEGGHSHGPGGHTHSHAKAAPAITEEQAKEKSKEELSRLVKAGKLEASWSAAEFLSIEKKESKGKQEWLAKFKNAAAADKAKAELFVFLEMSGKFVAANHTGK